jgi:hypothetical protein
MYITIYAILVPKHVVIAQNYLASFGLCPSSGMWKFYKRPQRFGDWISLRPQVDGAA